MSTSVFTLSEYAEQLQQLADEWEGDDAVVLVGDVTGNVNVTAKDGHTKRGTVGFAQELFDGNGVYELGQMADTRFFGTVLLSADDIDEEAREKIFDEEVPADE